MAGSNAGSNPVGRPPIITELVLGKLEEAFALVLATRKLAITPI